MARPKDLDGFIEETRARQRNIEFPDALRNSRSADVFLWRGSPRPTLVQRIAAWMFGLVFIGIAAESFSFAVAERSSFAVVLALVSMSAMAAFVGVRIFRNGFPRQMPEPHR
jgi:ammonia channel protein AmtB